MLPRDMHLWDIVKQRCSPIGQKTAFRSAGGVLSFGPADRLDLHGYTVQGAYEATRSFIEQARYDRLRRVTVITGRSGQIRREFPHWMRTNSDVARFIETRGGGGFHMMLRPGSGRGA